MNGKLILVSLMWFALGHIAVWFQLNGQFKWEWFKENSFILAMCGIPISFLYIWGTKYAVNGFDGLLWQPIHRVWCWYGSLRYIYELLL